MPHDPPLPINRLSDLYRPDSRHRGVSEFFELQGSAPERVVNFAISGSESANACL